MGEGGRETEERKGKGESHTCNTEEIGQNHRAKERRKRRMTLL